MKITDIHEVTIFYHVLGIVVEQKINEELFQRKVAQNLAKEHSIYIAIQNAFLELESKYNAVFISKPHQVVFSYKDAENYKHIMAI